MESKGNRSIGVSLLLKEFWFLNSDGFLTKHRGCYQAFQGSMLETLYVLILVQLKLLQCFIKTLGAVRLGKLVAKVPNVDTNSQDTETSLNKTILNPWSVKSMADLWLKYLDCAGFLEKLFVCIQKPMLSMITLPVSVLILIPRRQ